MKGRVVAVHRSASHSFSKQMQPSIRLLACLGVEGDAHCGTTMKHLRRLPREAESANLRQVHVLHAELHDDLRAAAFTIEAGAMGENITTRGVDLLALPSGARLHLGDTVILEIKGLRNPCRQLDELQRGLMAACIRRETNGELVRLAGVMAVVIRGGAVTAADRVEVDLPPQPHHGLRPV